MEDNQLDYNAILRHYRMFKKIIAPYDWEIERIIIKIVSLVCLIGSFLSIYFIIQLMKEL